MPLVFCFIKSATSHSNSYLIVLKSLFQTKYTYNSRVKVPVVKHITHFVNEAVVPILSYLKLRSTILFFAWSWWEVSDTADNALIKGKSPRENTNYL